MKKVAESAKAAGAVATKDMPGSLPRKLPMGFKHMGHPTHKAFDDLAQEASDIGRWQNHLEQAGHPDEQLRIACHATYRLEVGGK